MILVLLKMLDNRKKNWGGRGSIEISIVKFKRRKVCKNRDDVDIFEMLEKGWRLTKRK